MTFASLEAALKELSDASYNSFAAKDFATFDASFSRALHVLGVIVDQCFPIDDAFTPALTVDFRSQMETFQHWLTIADGFGDCLSQLEAADAALLEEMQGLVAQQQFDDLEECRARIVVASLFTKQFKAMFLDLALPSLTSLRERLHAKREAVKAAERTFQMRRPFPAADQLRKTSMSICSEILGRHEQEQEGLLNCAMRFVCCNLSSAAEAGSQFVAFANFNDRWVPQHVPVQFVRVLRDSWDGKSNMLLDFSDKWGSEVTAFLANAMPPPTPPPSPPAQPAASFGATGSNAFTFVSGGGFASGNFTFSAGSKPTGKIPCIKKIPCRAGPPFRSSGFASAAPSQPQPANGGFAQPAAAASYSFVNPAPLKLPATHQPGATNIIFGSNPATPAAPATTLTYGPFFNGFFRPFDDAEVVELGNRVSALLAEMHDMEMRPSYQPALLAVLADPQLRCMLIHRLAALGYAVGDCREKNENAHAGHLSQMWLVVNLWSDKGRPVQPSSQETWTKAYLQSPLRFPIYNHALLIPLEDLCNYRQGNVQDEVVGSQWLDVSKTEWCNAAAMGIASEPPAAV